VHHVIYRIEIDGAIVDERTVPGEDDPKGRHEAIQIAASHAAQGRQAAVYRLGRGVRSRPALIYFAPGRRDS
jgi:hypothetical protein